MESTRPDLTISARALMSVSQDFHVLEGTHTFDGQSNRNHSLGVQPLADKIATHMNYLSF
jgi:hypothetical protein